MTGPWPIVGTQFWFSPLRGYEIATAYGVPLWHADVISDAVYERWLAEKNATDGKLVCRVTIYGPVHKEATAVYRVKLTPMGGDATAFTVRVDPARDGVGAASVKIDPKRRP